MQVFLHKTRSGISLYFEDMIEYFGNLWSAEVLPTGTVTVGDPIDLGGVSGGWDDFDDFDICIEGITC